MTLANLLHPDVLKSIKHKTIILDANVFMEGYGQSSSAFSFLLEELAAAGCALTTIDAVRLEFFSKNRSRKELQDKIRFYDDTISNPALVIHTFEKEMQELPLLFAFGIQAQGFKTVDFMITAAMKKYATNVLLLTNDHSDFTPRLFDLVALLPLASGQGKVIPFGLYKFSEEKYASLLSASLQEGTRSDKK